MNETTISEASIEINSIIRNGPSPISQLTTFIKMHLQLERIRAVCFLQRKSNSRWEQLNMILPAIIR